MVQEKLDLIARDPEMFRAYEKYEKAERDRVSEINATRRERDREIAKKALAEGVPIELVSKITGLDIDSIKKLQGQ